MGSSKKHEVLRRKARRLARTLYDNDKVKASVAAMALFPANANGFPNADAIVEVVSRCLAMTKPAGTFPGKATTFEVVLKLGTVTVCVLDDRSEVRIYLPTEGVPEGARKFAVGQSVFVLHSSVGSTHIAMPATVVGYTASGKVEVKDAAGSSLRLPEDKVFATRADVEASIKNLRVRVDTANGTVTDLPGSAASNDSDYQCEGFPKDEEQEVKRQAALIDEKLNALPPEFTHAEKIALFCAEMNVRMQGGIPGSMMVYGPGEKEENVVDVPRSVRTGDEIRQHMWDALRVKKAWGCHFSYTSSPGDGGAAKPVAMTYYMTPQSLTVMQAFLTGPRSLGAWTRAFYPRPE